MQKLSYRHRISRVLGIGLLFFLLFSLPIYAQEKAVQDSTVAEDSEQADSGGSEDSITNTDGDPAAGKQIFNQNCAACHALDRKMTGPALGNVEQKIQDEAGLGRDWIYKWIKNSAGLISSGDEYANEIYNEYNKTAMTAFPTLSNEDIDNILAYTKAPPKKASDSGDDQAAAGGGASGGPSASSGISNEIILGALALVFGLLVVMLFLVNRTLQRIAAANGIAVEKDKSEKRLPIWKAFAQNQFLVLVSVVLLLLGGAYFAYGWMMQIGVDQGYAPIQPIHYSHRIHAGENKIECKYCHSSARVSKHSGIPSLNVCMNCHKSIYEVAEETLEKGKQEYGVDYNKEIKKLYAAVGWDEENQKYTGKTQPVEWIRIHNLPDFAYFNHSQHHIVGGIQCQECHGPVEEMEIMYQYSPLTMGWCINCHRETNVKVEGNAYYEKIHEQLAKKYGVETFTVAQMGGIECGKCHY